MHRTRMAFASTASVAALALLATSPAIAAQDLTAAPTRAITQVVLERSQATAEDVAAALESAYEIGYLGDDAPTTTDELEVMIDAVRSTKDGLESIEEATYAVLSDAAGLDASLTVDKVLVERVGEVDVVPTSSGDLSVTVDLQITRHIAEDDVDWVEILPHEMTLGADGSLEALTVQDLEYQLEQTEAAEPTPRLMIVPSDEPTTAIAPTALSATNRTKVADYAKKYALKPNTSYKLYSTDCTNFVSQAMLAGGWKEKTHPWVDYKWDTAWWYGRVPTASYSWTSAEHFYRMTKALSRTTTAKYVTDLRVGDLLQYKGKSAANMAHSMVVTKKSGTNIYLSYHTSNTLNRPFSELKKLDVSWFGHHV